MSEAPRKLDTPAKGTSVHSLLPDWLNAHYKEINAAINEVLSGYTPQIREIAEDAACRGRKLRGTMALQLAEWNDWEIEAADRVDLLRDIARIEILHSMSCALDDVLDKDDTRRGEPSFPARHGMPTTIRLIQLFIISFSLQEEIREMVEQAVRGEMYDSFLLAKKGIGNVENPVSNYLQKAAPLFAFANAAVAKKAKRPEDEIESARLYGQAIGRYYQVANDHHDCFTIPVDVRGDIGEKVPLTFSIPLYLYWKKNPEFVDEKLGTEVTRQELAEIIKEMKGAGIQEESEQFVKGLRTEIEGNFPGDNFPEELGQFLDMVDTPFFWSYKYTDSSVGVPKGN